MSTLNEQIQEAIRKDLPARIGEELRNQLNAGAAASARVLELEKKVSQLTEEGGQLREVNARLNSAAAGVSSRETDVKTRESAVKVREDKIAVLELEVTLRKEFNSTLRDVVKDVFSNNRFKYVESFPVVMPSGGGYIQPHERRGEGEGERPPAV